MTERPYILTVKFDNGDDLQMAIADKEDIVKYLLMIPPGDHMWTVHELIYNDEGEWVRTDDSIMGETILEYSKARKL